MQFNRSDSYSLCNKLPRLLSEEAVYDDRSVIIHNTPDYDVIRFSSLYNMSKYNNCSIQECLDTISHELTNSVVFVVNEDLFIYDDGYRKSVLESVNKYNIQLEYSKFTFDDVLESCIQCDLQNDTYYTDKLLEAVVIPDSNPNGQGTLQSARKTVDSATANAYAAGQGIKKGLMWLPNQFADFAKNLGGKMISAMDTDENREKFSNYMGKQTKQAIEKMTGAADDAMAPVKTGLTAGFVGGTILTGLIAGVNKLTSGENMGATGEKAAGIINTLQNHLGNLQSLQLKAPPQQQGIISRLIAKIKNAIVSLGRKMGL